MAEQLKNIISNTFIGDLSKTLSSVIADFDGETFIKMIYSSDWEKLELKERVTRISEVIEQYLPDEFPVAVEMIKDINTHYVTNYTANFGLMALSEYIERNGSDYFDESVSALELTTKNMSAEFYVRSFIVRYPERMMAKMLEWSCHDDPNVRRLSSEGCRPRLPWGMALKDLQKDPTPILPILENLKNDPNESVRKSVANNLNDISKDNPETVVATVERWQGINDETDKILKHACRTMLKSGDPKVMKLFGFGNVESVSIDNLSLDDLCIKIGDSTYMNFTLLIPSEEKLRLEYGIDYVKANKKRNRKIFQIAENYYQGNKKIDFRRKLSFENMTTRKHYPGTHSISIIVNGKSVASIDFELVD